MPGEQMMALTPDAYRRLMDLVAWAEAQRRSPAAPAVARRPPDPQSMVEVTGAAIDGLHPGKLVAWDDAAGAWVDVAEKAGTLTTRTDDVTGILTLPTGHGIPTGAALDVYWEDGARFGMTVGNVDGVLVPVDGGTGDDLPAQGTAVTLVAQVRFKEANGSTASAGDRVLARSTGPTEDKRYGVYTAARGSDGGFWARLTDKDTTGGYIKYAWTKVLDAGTTALSGWDETPTFGDFETNPAFEVNNHNVPVSTEPTDAEDYVRDDLPTVVWLRRGRGAYYLFEHAPRWEFIEILSAPDEETGYSDANQMYYDQETETWGTQEAVLALDLNAQEPPP